MKNKKQIKLNKREIKTLIMVIDMEFCRCFEDIERGDDNAVGLASWFNELSALILKLQSM